MKYLLLGLALAAAHPGHAQETVSKPTNYVAVAAAINETMAAWHYDPAELAGEAYLIARSDLDEVALKAKTDDEFLAGFREIWAHGPFSHVELNRARGTAADLSNYLDNLRVGENGAMLSWQGDMAILTVNTMMGLDTIEQIDAAYGEIVEKGASALVIDLRNNEGGAFAVRPLVGHLLAAPFDAGVFQSRHWNDQHDGQVPKKEVQQVSPWDGWSIVSFWRDVQAAPFLRIQFAPMAPVYSGPVYVLTSSKTASAAEMAADALKASGRATLVGERTAGKMLSQKIYDVPGGFHLSLPIADYYSIANGRIEGRGVAPDVESSADESLDVALKRVSLKQ